VTTAQWQFPIQNIPSSRIARENLFLTTMECIGLNRKGHWCRATWSWRSALLPMNVFMPRLSIHSRCMNSGTCDRHQRPPDIVSMDAWHSDCSRYFLSRGAVPITPSLATMQAFQRWKQRDESTAIDACTVTWYELGDPVRNRHNRAVFPEPGNHGFRITLPDC